MLQRIRDERGVAMVTVLLVASVLTVTASAATVMTIREFSAGDDDRQSAGALALAESGVDRMIVALKRSNWNQVVMAGCGSGSSAVSPIIVQGTTPDGSFEAVGTRATACPLTVPSPRSEQQLRIISTGTTREASRRVEQMIDVVAGSLPVGVFAHRLVTGSGSAGNFINVSVITPGNVNPRDQLDMQGWDLWYSQSDIYGPSYSDTTCDLNVGGCNYTNSLPAAVHAGGLITCGSADRCNKTTGPPAGRGPNTAHAAFGQDTVVDALPGDNIKKANLVCTADESGSESMWDGSGYTSTDPTYGVRGPTTGLRCSNFPGVPPAPNSYFTADQARALQETPALSQDQYDTLRDAARTSGVYCTLSGSTVTCRYSDGTSLGNQPFTVNLSKVSQNYVIYADFPASTGDPGTLPTLRFAGNTVLGACNTNPDLSRTGTVIVRYGNADFGGGADLDGAVIAEDGRVTIRGTADMNGTIIAEELDIQGDRTVEMDMCTLNALSFPLINVSAGAWREIDR